MKKLILLSLLYCWALPIVGKEVPKIHLNSSLPDPLPWDLDNLSNPPQFQWTNDKSPKSLYYEGEKYDGKPTRVFAYYATPGILKGDPSLDTNLPSIVLVHGGGGTAFPQWVRLWASRGFAAIAMDLAGCGPDRKKLPNGGPGQGHDMKFETIELPNDGQWTYHAVSQVIRAHSLLLSFPEVDSNRSSITGISWGGYLTCIVAGLDNRFKAAVPVYGCGFLHENSCWLNDFAKMSESSQSKWVRLWDPSQYVGSISMPILFVNGGKDFAYPPDSYAKTFNLVKSEKNIQFIPDLAHGHIFDKPISIELFINHHLKGKRPLHQISKPSMNDDSISASVAKAHKITKAELHYTLDPLSIKPNLRKWISLPARWNSNRIEAPLPPDSATMWFLTVEDERNAVVSSELIVP